MAQKIVHQPASGGIELEITAFGISGQNALAFQRATDALPESQILFGSDYAPEPIESTVDQLPGLKLPRAFEQMMLRGNAERLFPRFKLAQALARADGYIDLFRLRFGRTRERTNRFSRPRE